MFNLSTPVLIGLAVALIVQLTMLAIALIVLYRTPADRLVFEKKWPWVLIVVFLNFVGPVIFLTAGRREVQLTDEAINASSRGDAIHSVIDTLYGKQP